jgi:hypothetical protein
MATPEPQVIDVEVEGAPLRLRWDPAQPSWELGAAPDWSRLEAIRLVSALFEDGAALGVAAVRPLAADGHGDDVAVARFVDPEGVRIATSEALLSVEYDAAHVPRRLGIEVWPDLDSAPLRIAADRDPHADDPARGDRDAVPMVFRLGGVAGRGTYETVRRS